MAGIETLHLLLRLKLELEQEEEEDVRLAVLIRERECLIGRARRRWWVRPWIERRRLFGQYHTLFRELERESRGDYMSYMRMDPNLFGDASNHTINNNYLFSDGHLKIQSFEN